MQRKTSAHLFCGGGGGTFGTEKAGFECLWAIEKEKIPAAVHRFNFPNAKLLEADISSISDDTIRELTIPSILVAGPPCTNFSVIGDRTGIDGNDGKLSFEVVRVASIVRSPFLLVENVPGMFSMNEGQDFFRFISELDAIGYSGIATIVDGRHYVPQSRSRIYVQCIHKNVTAPEQQESKELQPFFERLTLSNPLAHLLKNTLQRCNYFDWMTAKTLSLRVVKFSWRSGYGKYPKLKFVIWHEGKVLAAQASFDNFPFSSATLQDHLEEDGIGIKIRGSEGDRLYTQIAPTFRGMNRASKEYSQPGTGGIKVVRRNGELRPILPTEVEGLMGWEKGSTSFGLTADSEKVEISTTQRVKMLSKAMIPGAIAHACEDFLGLLERESDQCLQQDTSSAAAVEIQKERSPQVINQSGQLSLISTQLLSTENDSRTYESLKPTSQVLPITLSLTSLLLQYWLEVRPALTSAMPEAVKVSLGIAEACFGNTSDFCDLKSLKSLYLKTCKESYLPTIISPFHESSKRLLKWGIWVPGNSGMGTDTFLRIDLESFVWVFTGDVRATQPTLKKPALRSLLEGIPIRMHKEKGLIETLQSPTLTAVPFEFSLDIKRTRNGKESAFSVLLPIPCKISNDVIKPAEEASCLLASNWFNNATATKSKGGSSFVILEPQTSINTTENKSYRKREYQEKQYLERNITPLEAERIMGWEENSTQIGINSEGTEVQISKTQRMKILGNGIIPAEITEILEGVKRFLVQKEPATLQEITSPAKVLSSPLKWVGKKEWVVDKVAQLYSHHRHRRWFDPFCGSATLPIALKVERAYLGDSVWGLVNFWKSVQQGIVIPDIEPTEETYYRLREQFNEVESSEEINIEAAIAFYLLNRMGYQGLCRHNKKKKLNVPFGRYKSPIINFDSATLQEAIAAWEFNYDNFEESLEKCKPDDFVFVDPPYWDKFSNYDGQGFNWNKQCKLAKKIASLDNPVIAFNSDHPEIISLYYSLGFDIKLIETTHFIGARNTRPKTKEMMATKNF